MDSEEDFVNSTDFPPMKTTEIYIRNKNMEKEPALLQGHMRIIYAEVKQTEICKKNLSFQP